jgi:small GTP-binding protein
MEYGLMISKKIVLIGDFSTGKTSLIRRFVDNQFSDKYLSTIGVKISRKNLSIEDKEIQNIIWDIEGGTDTKPLNPSYLLGSHGAIIVADVTRDSSIENIQNYIDMIQKVSAKIPVVIALNKSDLIGEDEGRELVDKLKESFSEFKFIGLTSAKNANGVELLFENLSQLMVL